MGCVFPVAIVSILPYAEFGPNDHRKDTSHFRTPKLIKSNEPTSKNSARNGARSSIILN